MLAMHNPIQKQRGVILVITLIALAAMTLAGAALMRSTDTTTLIAGNLAFQQSVTISADRGIEEAVSQLEATKQGNPKDVALPPFSSDAQKGYAARIENPPQGQNWDVFWANTLEAQSVPLAEDDAGNRVSYVIQRVCYGPAEGLKPSNAVADCPKPPIRSTSSMGEEGPKLPMKSSDTAYYRITVRIVGPHNNVNFVQAFVAL
jgi:Tfp pilus assembly protein PilX